MRSSNLAFSLQKVDGSCESIRKTDELAAEKLREKRGRLPALQVLSGRNFSAIRVVPRKLFRPWPSAGDFLFAVGGNILGG